MKKATFKRGSVSFYVKDTTKTKIARMSKELKITQSALFDALVEFGIANIPSLTAWVEGNNERRQD